MTKYCQFGNIWSWILLRWNASRCPNLKIHMSPKWENWNTRLIGQIGSWPLFSSILGHRIHLMLKSLSPKFPTVWRFCCLVIEFSIFHNQKSHEKPAILAGFSHDNGQPAGWLAIIDLQFL